MKMTKIVSIALAAGLILGSGVVFAADGGSSGGGTGGGATGGTGTGGSDGTVAPGSPQPNEPGSMQQSPSQTPGGTFDNTPTRTRRAPRTIPPNTGTTPVEPGQPSAPSQPGQPSSPSTTPTQ